MLQDFAPAFNGRRLCENSVGLLEEEGLSSWTNAGAVDKTEWINQIRTVSTINSGDATGRQLLDRGHGAGRRGAEHGAPLTR